jgi:hypothetical protein
MHLFRDFKKDYYALKFYPTKFEITLLCIYLRMFKKVLLTLVAFSAGISYSQPNTHPQQMLREKKVKSYKMTFTRKDDGKPVTDSSFVYLDSEGRIIRTSTKEGTEFNEYNYDEHGNRIRCLRVSPAHGMFPDSKEENLDQFTYDDKGRKISHAIKTPTREFVEHFVYDVKGNLVLLWMADKKGTEFIYDENNRLIKSHDYISDENFNHTSYSYKSNGDTINKIQYDSYGTPDTTRITWEYLGNGGIKKTEKTKKRLIVTDHRKDWQYNSIVKTERGKTWTVLACIYDSKGLPTESTLNERYKSVYTYNEKGLIIKEQKADLENNDPDYFLFVYSYVYFEK